MFGLDEQIAGASDGRTLLIVMVVAVLLGLRHASDPDHLAAVTTLLASKGARGARTAGALGLAWGIGHALSLFCLGLPIVLYRAYLPVRAQAWTETSVGLLIVVLACWLLLRWRRGAFAVHVHSDGGPRHSHGNGLEHPRRSRSRSTAFGIGVLHGLGGTAGVGILLLGAIPSHGLAIASLAVFAAFTAISMTVLSSGLGLTLGSAPARRAFHTVAPALGLTSLAFGVWYALGAQGLLPYAF